MISLEINVTCFAACGLGLGITHLITMMMKTYQTQSSHSGIEGKLFYTYGCGSGQCRALLVLDHVVGQFKIPLDPGFS